MHLSDWSAEPVSRNQDFVVGPGHRYNGWFSGDCVSCGGAHWQVVTTLVAAPQLTRFPLPSHMKRLHLSTASLFLSPWSSLGRPWSRSTPPTARSNLWRACNCQTLPPSNNMHPLSEKKLPFHHFHHPLSHLLPLLPLSPLLPFCAPSLTTTKVRGV